MNDISSQIISEYGLAGIMILAIGYIVWELLKERRRSEARLDAKHKEHIDDIQGIHKRHDDRIEKQHREYREEMKSISGTFAASLDRISGSVNNLSGKVDRVVEDVEDLRERQRAHERRHPAPSSHETS